MAEAQSGIGLILGERARGAAAEPPYLRSGQKSPNLRPAGAVTFVPLPLDAMGAHVVIPVLGTVRPGVFVPQDRLRRVKQLVALREGADRQRDLLAVKIQLRIVRHLGHERS